MEQKVYLVFMVIDYEGVFQSSMKVFSSLDRAEKYRNELKQTHGTSGNRFEIMDFTVN